MSAIIIGGSKLNQEDFTALNALLFKHGGNADGIPFYKISWAADDNKGLARKHTVSCPKTDAADWDCLCPIANPNHIPLCFHEHQACYHLLSWEVPTASMMTYEKEMAEDYSRGSYSCIGLHFVDPKTGIPFNPTAALVEKIIPTLKIVREQSLAAMHGATAVVDKLRRERVNRIQESEKKKDEDWDKFADDALKDSMTTNRGFSDLGSKKVK